MLFQEGGEGLDVRWWPLICVQIVQSIALGLAPP